MNFYSIHTADFNKYEQKEKTLTLQFIPSYERSVYVQKIEVAKKSDKSKQITSLDTQDPIKESYLCIFCKINHHDKEGEVIEYSESCMAMKNKYPYVPDNAGVPRHILVIPKLHRGTIADYSNNTLADLMVLAKKKGKELEGISKANSIHYWINQGIFAGASKPDHMHMHVMQSEVQDIQSSDQKGCSFCEAIGDNPERDEKNLIVKRFAVHTVMMSKRPFATGNIVIVPNKHVSKVIDYPDHAIARLMGLAKSASTILRQEYSTNDFNFGIKQAYTESANKPHIHMNVVPRKSGDISGLAATQHIRLIEKDPQEVCKRLRVLFETIQEA